MACGNDWHVMPDQHSIITRFSPRRAAPPVSPATDVRSSATSSAPRQTEPKEVVTARISAPRMVGGAQQSILRPLDRAAANLAAAGTMESCAMILRAVHPWGLARPSKMSVPGELLAAVRKGGRPMRPTLACDQWLCWQHRGHHRRCRAQRAASGTVRSFTTLPR